MAHGGATAAHGPLMGAAASNAATLLALRPRLALPPRVRCCGCGCQGCCGHLCKAVAANAAAAAHGVLRLSQRRSRCWPRDAAALEKVHAATASPGAVPCAHLQPPQPQPAERCCTHCHSDRGFWIRRFAAQATSDAATDTYGTLRCTLPRPQRLLAGECRRTRCRTRCGCSLQIARRAFLRRRELCSRTVAAHNVAVAMVDSCEPGCRPHRSRCNCSCGILHACHRGCCGTRCCGHCGFDFCPRIAAHSATDAARTTRTSYCPSKDERGGCHLRTLIAHADAVAAARAAVNLRLGAPARRAFLRTLTRSLQAPHASSCCAQSCGGCEW